jgi:hypothetical protein
VTKLTMHIPDLVFMIMMKPLMHTVWQLPPPVAGLVVLLLQLLEVGAAAATGAAAGLRPINTRSRSAATRCVLKYTCCVLQVHL